MYTAKITESTLQRAARRLLVKVEFTRDESSFTQEFQFGLNSDQQKIDATIRAYAKELEAAEQLANSLSGEVDLSEPTSTETVDKTEEENKARWLTQYTKYKNLVEAKKTAEDAGLPFTDDENTELQALAVWVRENGKPEYFESI